MASGWRAHRHQSVEPLRDMGGVAVPVRRQRQPAAGLRLAERLGQDGLEIHATLPPTASFIQQEVMQLIPQAIFDVFSLSLPRGHGFGDRPPIGAWGDATWQVCGVITQHVDDRSLGVLAMRRRVDGVWVVTAEEVGFTSLDAVKTRLEALLRIGEPPEPIPPNTARRPALHDLGARTASDVFQVLQRSSHHWGGLDPTAALSCAAQTGPELGERLPDRQLPHSTVGGPSCLLLPGTGIARHPAA